MKVVLHEISRREDGLIDIVVSFGNDPPKRYLTSYECSDEKGKYCGIDEELFMTLSNLAHKRFGNCIVYQIELMGIIGAFDDGEKLLELPAELGTTEFCTIRPGLFRVVWNKLRIFMRKMRILRPRIEVDQDRLPTP